MKPLRIVKALPEDMKTLLVFIKALAKYEKLEDQVFATEEKLRLSLFQIPAPAEVVFIEIDSKKVGFALYFTSYSTFLGKSGIYLEDLFVLPEFRGHGCGKTLFSYLASLAIGRHCGRLEWSVLDWNEPALKFYQSFAAQPMDQWTVHRLTGPELASVAQTYQFDQV